MKKKWLQCIAAVCIAAVCLFSLAACGGKKATPSGTSSESGTLNPSGAQAQTEKEPAPAGDAAGGAESETAPGEPEPSYEIPGVPEGYVLIREEPDSGRDTVYWYDSDGRIMEQDKMDLNDSSKVEAHFIYAYQDKEDGSCFVTSTAQEDFLYGYYEYLYDSEGRMLSMARYRSYGYETPEYTEEYNYDSEGRLARTTYESGSYDAFEYDDAGNLIREGSYGEDGTEISYTEYTLDENGRAVHEHFLKLGSVGDNDWEWSYLWDESGRLTKAEARDGQNSTRFLQLYTYDEAGNLVELVDKHEGVTYFYAPLAEALMP